jgi:uncharacterized protein YdaU (DUF1376 family)
MNFFKLFIGDYQRDTGALSLAEHGAYMMMLQHYYATELPLPSAPALYRLLRAQSKPERDAIDSIVARFWVLKDGALVNTRAVAEIERAVRQRDVNREIGKRGGRPRQTEQITESVSESVSEREPNDNPSHSHSQKEQKKDQKIPAAKKPAAGPSRKTTFTAWIESLPEGQDAIPETHHVFAYADRVKIPRTFLDLAWIAFERRYSSDPKRYTDWPAVFRKAVEANWYHLWFMRPDGSYELTTAGRQLAVDTGRLVA